MPATRARAFLFMFLCGGSLAAKAYASIESELNARWRGTWTTTRVETFSDCGVSYTNNEIRERRVSARGEHRLGAGELAKVHKVDLKRRQVEILLDVAEPLRVSYREGPFTLYEQLSCRLELQIKLPRGPDARSMGQIEDLIASVLERHDSLEAAETSVTWNGRLREPLPENYDDTLYEVEIWRAEQFNAQVARRIEDFLDEAARRVDRLDNDPEYLAGFAEGVDRARRRSLDKDCERLASMSSSAFVRSGPDDRDRKFRDGFREGQELVFYLEAARRLQRCFVPPPL